MTANPKWEEIQSHLFPGQTAADRPILVARVFNIKLKALLDDLKNKHVLGKRIAHIHVIEYQLRGLPHCHLLLIVDDKDKPNTNEKVDCAVSAHFPDPKKNPKLHKLVTQFMVHKNCKIHPNRKCAESGVCCKHFPKPFRSTTNYDVD